MRNFQCLVILVLLFPSCHNNANEENKSLAQHTALDSNKTKLERRFYARTIQLSNLLNLNRLDRGVDSTEIRLWTASMLEPEELLTIKYIEKEWRVTETFYWTSKNKLDSLKTVSITPKINIENFIDSLKLYNLSQFPSQEELQDFQDNVADGINYVFQIATKDSYKVFSYHCPDLFNDAYNKKASKLIKFFSKNISALRICKY